MTVPDRVLLAAADENVVIGASGLLADFNDAGLLAPIDVLSAMTIGRIGGEQNPQVLLAAALAVRGTRHGHVCVRLATQHEAVFVDGQTAIDTDLLAWPAVEGWIAAVAASDIVGSVGDDTPLVLVDDRLYLQRYYSYEESIAGIIDAAVAEGVTPLDPAVAELLDEAFSADSAAEPNQQRVAAEIALGSRLAVIAGGPGTGKTYTIAAMLSALAQADGAFPTVALVAPTGKAAARLGEALTSAAEQLDGPARDRLLNVKSSTIHRLLGFHRERGRFAHDKDNRLPYDMVIVDEMSMVSLTLAAKLLSALRDDATLVMVGDPDQLVSIEAGTVLADIMGPARDDSSAVAGGSVGGSGGRTIENHIVVLDKVHRFTEGGAIAKLSVAIRRGDADAAVELLQTGSDDLVWIPDSSGDALSELATRVIDHRVKLVELSKTIGSTDEALAQLNELAVLAAHRNGPQSVDYWRRLIEHGLDEKFPGMRARSEWYPGQPIMITANDRTLDLYNGDIGVTVETEDGLRVAFKGAEIRTFHRSHIGEHATVHAMTIHKSQGSQYNEVVVVLPPGSSPLLTRELLYTAVTRAAKKVALLGPEDTIRQAINRPVERATGLGVRLWD